MTKKLVKLQVVSDLHLDVSTRVCDDIIRGRTIVPKGDVLIIAGDTSSRTGRDTRIVGEVFDYLYDNWEYIIEVPGNHDFWNSDYGYPDDPMFHSSCEIDTNKHWMLQNGSLALLGINFHGTTLWSDIPEEVRDYASTAMVDYSRINGFTPADSTSIFHDSVQWLDSTLTKNCTESTKDVVITHHVPTLSMTSKQYVGSRINPCFSSDVEHLMKKHSIKTWIHGHSHNFMRKKIHGVDVVRNPHGYGGRYAEQTFFKDDFIVKV